MLTSLRIRNFKAWKDTGEVRLAPLTMIFGANSAGKSSIGHLLLALKQTALATDRKRALHLGDTNSLIDLGTLSDCLYKHDSSATLEFEIAWNLPKPLAVRDLHDRSNAYSGNSLYLRSALKADKKEQPEIQGFEYRLRDGAKTVLDIRHERNNGSGGWALNSNTYKFVQAVGRKWNLTEPEKFYRVSETSISRYQNASFLTDFALATERMLAGISYLGPLREHPQRIYQWSGDTPEDVGQTGKLAVAAILAAEQAGRWLNRGRKKPRRAFPQFIAEWLKDIEVINDFEVKSVAKGRKEFEVLLNVQEWSPKVKITDVGFGVSQVLPALVQAFYCAPNSTVWMEQPEIHLHPQVQSDLADVFISAVKAYENGTEKNAQLIIESHSEHLLTRLQRRVAEGAIEPDEVAIYFCRNTKDGAVLEKLELNLLGEIDNWPENFFGDQMTDMTERVKAGLARDQQGARA
jgi:predicted ATPase